MIFITILLICLILLGVPIAFALGVCSVLFIIFSDIPLSFIAHQMVITNEQGFSMLAIPFFVFVGELMNQGEITDRIFSFCKSLVGHIRGGLAYVNILDSMIFAGMSGSAVADVSGLGMIEYEVMVKNKYDPEFSAALTGATAVIGPIIPPSIPMVIFGVMAQVSIARLFIGGFFPGVLLGLSMMAMVYFYAGARKYPKETRASIRQILKEFYRTFLALLLPVFMLLGISLGVTSVTEAGIIADIYALILSGFIYQTLTVSKLIDIFRRTFDITARIMFIILTASVFGWIVTHEQMITPALDWIKEIGVSPWVVLLLFNILLLILGCVMESIAIMLIVGPFIIPVVSSMGISLVHFGVVMVLNLMIGLMTPPFGLLIFLLQDITGLSAKKIIMASIPFIVIMIGVLLLVTYFPFLTTWLPNLIFGVE